MPQSALRHSLVADHGQVLTHERVRTAPQHALTDVAFAPGYRAVFATAGGSDVRLWALDSQAELLRICEPGLVCSCLAFSADGSALVSGWSDGRIRACVYRMLLESLRKPAAM